MAKIDIIGKIVGRCRSRNFDGGRGEKVINFFDKFVSVPENRLIIGVTALASQPFIDLYNQDVDRKTRVFSCARTIAKNFVGMVTGVAIRAGFIKLAQKYSEVEKTDVKSVRKLFTPSEALSSKTHAYTQYRNTIGTLLAVVGMLFTNFLVDAPLTKWMTNALIRHFEKAGQKSSVSKEGSEGVLNEKS